MAAISGATFESRAFFAAGFRRVAAYLMSAAAASRPTFSSSDRSCFRSVNTDSAVASFAICDSNLRSSTAHSRGNFFAQSRSVFSFLPSSFAAASHEEPRARSSAAASNWAGRLRVDFAIAVLPRVTERAKGTI